MDNLGRNIGQFIDTCVGSPSFPGVPGPYEMVGMIGDGYGQMTGSTFSGINDFYNSSSGGHMDSYQLTDMAHEANFPHY